MYLIFSEYIVSGDCADDVHWDYGQPYNAFNGTDPQIRIPAYMMVNDVNDLTKGATFHAAPFKFDRTRYVLCNGMLCDPLTYIHSLFHH